MTFEMNKKKSIVIISVVAIILIAAVSIVFLMQSGNVDSLEHQLNLAYKYLSEGRYDEAIIAFDKVIGIDPKNIEARLGKIEAYTALGQPEKAEEIRREIIELGVSDEELAEYVLDFERKLDEWKTNGDIHEENDTPEPFQSIDWNEEVATKHNIVAHREDGIYVRNLDSSNYEKVYSTKECRAATTNGKIIYFVSNEDGYIKALNLEDGTAEDLYKTKLDTRWGHSLVEDMACDGKYLTFSQGIDSAIDSEPGAGYWCVLDLETKECTEYEDEESWIPSYICGVRDGEIYYQEFGGGAFIPSDGEFLLKTDISDPRKATVVTAEGVFYTIIGNSVYYAVFEVKTEGDDWSEYLSEIKIMDLDTGAIRTIIPKCYTDREVYFFEKGFGTYDYETDEWYYETYDGEVVEMDGDILKWTDSEVIYA